MSLRIEPYVELIPGYRLLERLGGGGFGEVWKAEAPGGFHKAVKIIHGDIHHGTPEEVRHAEKELRALQRVQSVRHPFLLSLERYDIVQGRLVIVTELADCNLWDRFRQYINRGLPGIPRDELLRYLDEAAEVLDLLNTCYQLQHLDIKPQNLFLLHNHIKVGDFGLVRDLDGLRGVVSGGVTPVYAAPETFDGVISRSCDQYSLAVLYQELLTGQRPFVGASVSRLVAQHLEAPPDLTPLAEPDRAAVARALAKRPEERFPSCSEFVRALRAGGAGAAARAVRPAPAGKVGPGDPTPVGSGPAPAWEAPAAAPTPHLPPPAAARPPAPVPSPLAAPRRPPAEQSGPGVLRPAVVVGLGRAGVEVVCRFRARAAERFGPAEGLPNLRLLAIDTDPEVLRAAAAAGLARDEVLAARLNRPGHYLQPRRHGRTLIDGWLEPQVLYRIPRPPATAGVRALGRLAFCDHSRAVTQQLQAGLAACTDPAALEAANRATGLGLRTNRPVVYVVAHLGGGTGGGMFLDLAYTARHKLRQLGYADPEVVGLLVLPAPDDRSPEGFRARANAFAALTELNHFCRADTVFTCLLEDREGAVEDAGPPFGRCLFLTAPPPGPPSPDGLPAGSADRGDGDAAVLRQAADYLERDLLTPFGRRADQERERVGAPPAAGPALATFGAAALSWPRQAVLVRAAHREVQRLLEDWLAIDPQAVEPAAAARVGELWAAHAMDPDELTERLRRELEQHAGPAPEALFEAEAAAHDAPPPLAPDPDRLWQSLQRLQGLVGLPDAIETPPAPAPGAPPPAGGAAGARAGELGRRLGECSARLAREFAEEVCEGVASLLEEGGFRVPGAEAVCQRLQALAREAAGRCEQLGREHAEAADRAYFALNGTFVPGSGSALNAAEAAAALRAFAGGRYQALLLRQVCDCYAALLSRLGDLLRDLHVVRRRLGELAGQLRSIDPGDDAGAAPGLLPAGCRTAADAAAQLLGGLTPHDRGRLERWVQAGIERQFPTLYRACVNSVDRLDELGLTVFEQTRLFLDQRLGRADLVGMFFARHPAGPAAGEAIRRAYEAAAPGPGAPAAAEFCILGLPPGEPSEAFELLARQTLDRIEAAIVGGPDEIVFYRERACRSLGELPHLGPDGCEAYLRALEADSFPPHARTDIREWAPVETAPGAGERE